MCVKISAVIIGSIEIDIDALKKIDGVNIFKVTDRKSCDEIVNKISGDDLVFIISDGREVYYAEKFFARIMALKIFLVTEAQAAANKNLRDAIIQFPAQNFTQKVCEVINMFSDMTDVEEDLGLNFVDVQSLLKNSGKAVAIIAVGKNFDDALNNALEGHDIKSAQEFLIIFKAAQNMVTMAEINAVTEKFQALVREDAEILWNVTTDESFGDKVKITILATKFF